MDTVKANEASPQQIERMRFKRKIGHRLTTGYRLVAVMLLNIVVFIIGLEILATITLAIIETPTARNILAQATGTPNDVIDQHYLRLPYYRDQAWSIQYWQEHKLALKKKYQPYVIWRSPPFEGQFLKIDQNGIRYTPGAECEPQSYRIFLFGGSAMWGWGAPDWGTIPAYLQTELQAIRPKPVCVVNFGEQAYVSTQSLIQLMLLLEAGDIPDMVIFYDGVNEVLAASQVGQPIIHQNFRETATIFEDSQPSLIKGLQTLNSFTLFQMVISQLHLFQRENASQPTTPVATGQLAEAVVQAYLSNYKSVAALAESYGFDYYFLWQPYILTGNKPLTSEEQAMITGLNWVFVLDQETSDLFVTTYERVALEAADLKNFYSMVGAFDQYETQIWIDTWGHVTPIGNQIIAKEIIAIIKDVVGK